MRAGGIRPESYLAVWRGGLSHLILWGILSIMIYSSDVADRRSGGWMSDDMNITIRLVHA